MKLAVIYHSRTGNTRQAAEWIAEGMNRVSDAEAKAFSIDDADTAFVGEAKGVVVSSGGSVHVASGGSVTGLDAEAGAAGRDKAPASCARSPHRRPSPCAVQRRNRRHGRKSANRNRPTPPGRGTFPPRRR